MPHRLDRIAPKIIRLSIEGKAFLFIQLAQEVRELWLVVHEHIFQPGGGGERRFFLAWTRRKIPKQTVAEGFAFGGGWRSRGRCLQLFQQTAEAQLLEMLRQTPGRSAP